MSCYIIPIGGTGERVMRAITHFAAAGVFNRNTNVRMLGIDPDSISAAKSILIDTMSEYEKLYKENVFKADVRRVAVKGQDPIWTPMVKLHVTLNDDVGTTTNEQKLFEFLYSKRERGLDLAGGFYSHTSIGSYYILNGIVDSSDGKFVEPWKSFFSGIKPEDKIVIICSMFGGTGASGVPTIARELRRHNVTGEDTSKAKITGVFLEPYFSSEEADTVNTAAFPTKSKIAFEYYNQQNFGKDIFDSMYFLGESKDMMKVKHHESGEKQRNKANVIELYAATAVLNELLNTKPRVPEECDVLITTRGTDKEDGVFDRAALKLKDENGKITNIFKRLAYFMAFCVMYTKAIYPLIESHQRRWSVYQAAILNKYSLTKKVDGNESPSDEAATLFSYCKRYIEWMREIITESKGFEDFNPEYLNDGDSEDFKYTKWFNRKAFSLYNATPDTKASTPLEVADINGFEHMITGKSNRLPSSQAIYNALCDKKGNGHKINELVEDMFDLMKKLKKLNK